MDLGFKFQKCHAKIYQKMITCISDLKRYLELDKAVLGIRKEQKHPHFYGNELWKYLIVLRHYEYYANCHKSFTDRVKLLFFSHLHHYWSIWLGFSIPPNTFDAGLKLNHYGSIVVNPNARIGKFCDIHVDVNIGQNYSSDEVPTIGDNVWIGPGVKIFGKIHIADGIMIGANSVVNKSFDEPNITIAGNPAKKIKDTGNPFKRSL